MKKKRTVSTVKAARESEIGRLVRVASDGIAAVYEIINNHPGEVLHSVAGQALVLGFGKTRCDFDIGSMLSVKPRAAFESFFVNLCGPYGNLKPSLVSIVGAELHVGCWKFNVKAARTILRKMLTGEEGVKSCAGLDFQPTCLGIWTNKGSISWADVSKILKSIERAGVK
jgi:hypothetical protein